MGATMAAKSWCLIIAGLWWRAGLLAAQLPAADEAFRRGRLAEARAGYERALASDSLNVRALYRLAILDGWDAKLDRSLARFTKLRRLEPRDPDFMVAHARVLSWAGRTQQSLALFDSVLARAPRWSGAVVARRALAASRRCRAALRARADTVLERSAGARRGVPHASAPGRAGGQRGAGSRAHPARVAAAGRPDIGRRRRR